MRPHRAALLVVAAGLLVPSAALACMWDYDTIKMERSRFPGALELITGKFLRHSPEFYEWRIKNRLKRLEADPTNASLLDDLAVAYDKTGQHEKAIETAQKTERLHPGRYETASNLGTFYFHAGRPEEGIPHIDRALKINPDAHFGREKYQKFLTEYVIERRKDGVLKLPMYEVQVTPTESRGLPNPEQHAHRIGFADHLQRPWASPRPAFDRPAAIKGVLGMMRFAKHDSPVLLEALGMLLHDEGSPTEDAKLLAARALLKASYEVPNGPARESYRRMADSARRMQTTGGGSLAEVEANFQKELEEGRAWYADLRERELSWIRDGKDPEAEFDKLYDAEPEVSGMDVRDPMTPDERMRWFLIGLGVAFALMAIATLVGVGFIVRHIRRGRAV